MKLLQQKYIWIIATIVMAVGYFVSCTKNDQVLDQNPVAVNSSELVSLKVSTAPAIDGTIDAIWDNAAKMTILPTVPDPGNGLFTGYSGQSYQVTLRSMYDNQYIYFLAEVKDAAKNVKSAPWYFDPVTHLWAKEPNAKTFNSSGALTRDGFGLDQLAMLWNVDNSTPKFTSQTCYASCHIFTPYLDYSVTPPVMKANASGNHYTNGASEKIDMWWAHPARGLVFGNMDDEYQDWAGGPGVTNLVGGSGNGRHFDDLVVSGASTTWPYAPTYTSDATQGSYNNTQNLKLDGTGVTVAVPLWLIPNSNNDYIKVADTLAGGAAVKITGVSTAGVLSYSGGSIDPNTGTDYQRTGDAVTGATAAKAIPSVILSPVLRGRADITMSAVYTGSGWVYEYKRLLKTGDVLKQDIDFTSLQDQPFGVAYFNNSNYQHGIKPNLLLKFQK
jgi:Ethylbenzene dehydrogenase/Carbohydrate family 9 binding domain-like